MGNFTTNKKHIFICNPLAPRAMLALQKHRDTYPNGREVYSGRSNRTVYVSLGYVIYETKTTVVIDLLK